MPAVRTAGQKILDSYGKNMKNLVSNLLEAVGIADNKSVVTAIKHQYKNIQSMVEKQGNIINRLR